MSIKPIIRDNICLLVIENCLFLSSLSGIIKIEYFDGFILIYYESLLQVNREKIRSKSSSEK